MTGIAPLLVSSDQSLFDALKAIHQGRMQIALVVDAGQRLIGTVTDGDVRRHLVRGGTTDSPVTEAMNAKPLTVREGEDRRTIEALMRRKVIHQVPILDTDDRVVDICVLGKHPMVAQFENPVVLMAGGFGTRLDPLTQIKPKPMLSIGGKPILQTILESFVAQGFWRFYISVYYKSDMIEEYFGEGSKWNVDIQYIREDSPSGTAGALALLPEDIKLPIVVMNGDILCRIDLPALLKFHQEGGYNMTACVSQYKMTLPFGRVVLDGPKVQELVEKPVSDITINAGIYVLDPSLLAAVPKDSPAAITDLIDQSIATNAGVGAFPIDGYWRDVGSHKEFERANREYQDVFGDD